MWLKKTPPHHVHNKWANTICLWRSWDVAESKVTLCLTIFWSRWTIKLNKTENREERKKREFADIYRIWISMRNYKYCTTYIMKRWFAILSSLIHHIMSIAAVMQLFTCPFDNDTSHVQLYLTLGMLSCRMTHICFHRNRRFQCGLCNWIWWICPFLDNGAAQLRGHQRALTPCWPDAAPGRCCRLNSAAWLLHVFLAASHTV